MQLTEVQILIAALVALSVVILNVLRAWKLWRDLNRGRDELGQQED